MPEYYAKLLYLWESESKDRMYAVMAKNSRWFLVEHVLTISGTSDITALISW